VVHAVAGISKRLLVSSSLSKSSNIAGLEPSGRRPLLWRPLTSLLSLSGYAIVLVFLPVHVLVHRYYPTLRTDSISSVGPSSLDYEFVKYGLYTWPWRSWFLYVSMIGSVALHIADGTALIWNTWFKNSNGWGKLSRKTRRVISIAGIVVPVLSGLVVMVREPPFIMSFLANRYRVTYMQSFVFRV